MLGKYKKLLKRIKSLEEFLGVRYHEAEEKYEDNEHLVTGNEPTWNRMAALDKLVAENRQEERKNR